MTGSAVSNGSQVMVAKWPVRWAWLVTGTLAAASVLLRVIHRGPYTPGWDVLGAAEGLYLVSTLSPREILDWYVTNHWNSQIGWSFYGVFSVLLPGLLASLWPWPFWNHVFAFVVTVAVIALLAVAFELGRRESWLVVLGWCASPLLVSQSVTGIAYVTCALPHALALCVVRRLRDRWLWTALLGVLVYLLAWQGQELGRTASLVFLVAVVSVQASWPTRLVWLAVGGFMAVDAVWHPTYNTVLSGMGRPTLRQLADVALHLSERLFVRPTIDLPILIICGALSALLLRRERWFWRLMLAAQVALLVLLALHRGIDGVWPRRFLMVDFYALAAALALWSEWRASLTRATVLIGLLAVGASWQLADTVRFVREPLDPTAFTLPFVQSTVDYAVTLADVDWAQQLTDDVRAGHSVLLAYNYLSYQENPTNPSGVPERLYLTLGHERFVGHVFLFGDVRRWIDIPIHRMSEVDEFVADIGDAAEFVGYLAVHPADSCSVQMTALDGACQRRAEVNRLLAALERRFTIVWDAPRSAGPSLITRFTLRPWDAPS
jgi:hypothetical protein